MRNAWLVAVTAVVLSATEVHGDPGLAKAFADLVANGNQTPRFALGTQHVPAPSLDIERPIYTVAADGSAAWVIANLDLQGPCGGGLCGLLIRAHATVLYERDATDRPWRPVAWAVELTSSAKEQAERMKAPAKLERAPIARKLEPGAEAAAKLFESTVGDPKALAGTVADRKDVVLFGSETSERIEGAPQVRATIAKWNLAFKINGGLNAGITAKRNVAWVAANLDARSAKAPRGAATPYRALFLYEQTGAAWKLVHAHFAFIEPEQGGALWQP